MTDKTTKIAVWVSLAVALVALFVSTRGPAPIREEGFFGAVGNLLAENYIPYVLYNGGYNSAKDLTISGATTLSGTNTLSGATTLSATTTITRSFDGFMAGGGIAPASVATSTVFTLYTHAGGPAICDSSTAAGYWDSTAFSPSLVFSVGTSTSAIASTNLIASSTIATTTDSFRVPTAETYLFVLNAGDVITSILGDITNTSASSTYYANWDVEFAVECWLVGQ